LVSNSGPSPTDSKRFSARDMTSHDRAVEAPDERARSVTAQISTEMVRLYKDLFGRGPTLARTNFAGPDVVIVTLEETLTPAERTMAELGEHQRLRDVRLFFQYAREQDFRELIERATGRQVRAFISGMDTRADVACELFYLQPQSRPQPVRPAES
jgi:uncharacterized protein YbcI